MYIARDCSHVIRAASLVVKWQVSATDVAPAGLDQKLYFLLRLLTNPWIISSFAAAFGCGNGLDAGNCQT